MPGVNPQVSSASRAAMLPASWRRHCRPRPTTCRPPAPIPTNGGVGAQLADVVVVTLAEDVAPGNGGGHLGQDHLALAPRGYLPETGRCRTGPPRSAEESPPLIAEGHSGLH